MKIADQAAERRNRDVAVEVESAVDRGRLDPLIDYVLRFGTDV